MPIVFATGSDPVQDGLVTSLNRPGGNVTGVNFFDAVLGAKRLEMLRELMPKATTVGVLAGPDSPGTVEEIREVLAAAQALGQQVVILNAANAEDIAPAFAAQARGWCASRL